MYFASAIMFLATAVRSCRAFVPRAGLTMAPVRAPVRMFSGIEMRGTRRQRFARFGGRGAAPPAPGSSRIQRGQRRDARDAAGPTRRRSARSSGARRRQFRRSCGSLRARRRGPPPPPRRPKERRPVPPAPPPRPARLQQLTATSPRFNTVKGYGFITPDNGGGDVFVHQTQIYARGFRSLAEGENVEFEIEMDQNGRERAVSVTGPEGDYVQGAPRPEPRYEDSY